MRQVLLVELNFAARGHRGFRLALIGQLILQIGNQFEDALLRVPRALFLFVPVWDGAAQINSLDLLDVGADDLPVLVTHWPDPNEVNQHGGDHVAACEPGMLFREVFVANARDDELELTRLAAVNQIVGIEH